MKANRNLFISARVDKETKEWMENHPLSASNLINYSLYLIRTMERNVSEAKTYMTSVSKELMAKETLTF